MEFGANRIKCLAVTRFVDYFVTRTTKCGQRKHCHVYKKASIRWQDSAPPR